MAADDTKLPPQAVALSEGNNTEQPFPVVCCFFRCCCNKGETDYCCSDHH